MRGERRLRAGDDADQAVALRPRALVAQPAARDGSPQRLTEPEQVVCASAHGVAVARLEQRLQHREVVLEVVVRAIGILRRGPREARAAFVGRLGREHAVIGDAAGDRAHHVERVEGRHARARLRDVEPRVGQVEPLGCGADRDLEQQALGAPAPLLIGERRIDRRPPIVEQQRILAGPLRDDALGEARHEDDAKRAAARLMRRPDEDASVAARRRLPVERDEPIVQHVARFLERHRPDRRHRPQMGEHLQHARRPPQRRRGERAEAIDPLTPRRTLRPLGERVDDRQREPPQVRQVRQIALVAPDAGRLGLFRAQRRDPVAVIAGQSLEAAPPARAAVGARAPADDRRFDD